MKYFLLGCMALASALRLHSQSCDSTHIIEFGTLDNPCVISSLVLSSREIRHDWYCDGTHVSNYDRNNMHITDNFSHSYMLIVSDTFGCTDTARATLVRSMCEIETGIMPLSDSSHYRATCLLDLSGKILWRKDTPAELFDERSFASLPRGIYIVIYENKNGNQIIKKHCAF